MGHPNKDKVDRFFEAYGKRDMNDIKEVMSDDVTWVFMGRHPLAGMKVGFNEVIAFFDRMGKIMERSKPTVEKLIVSENEKYFIECIYTTTHNSDGNNIDHHACVLWTIENGKIIEGRHFFANPQAVDNYFTVAASKL